MSWGFSKDQLFLIQKLKNIYLENIKTNDLCFQREFFETCIFPRKIFSDRVRGKRSDDINQGGFVTFGWESKLGDGALSSQAGSIIAQICHCQAKQKPYLGVESNFGTPEDLLFEELKYWCVAISHLQCDQNILDQVKRRKSYLTAVLARFKFNYGEQAFRDIHMIISESMLSVVADIVEKQGISENISFLMNHSKKIIDEGFKFIYYVLRDTPATPQYASIYHVLLTMTHHDGVFSSVLQSRSGHLLTILLRRPEFMSYFQQYRQSDQFKADELSYENDFLSDYQQTIPLRQQWNRMSSVQVRANKRNKQLKLTGNLIPDRNRLRRWLGGVHSGILPLFENNKPLLCRFIDLNGYLQELIIYLDLFNMVKSIANLGGEYSLSATLRKSFSEILTCFYAILELFIAAMNFIYHAAAQTYRSTCGFLQSRYYSEWRTNFKQAESRFYIVKEQYQLLLADCGAIQQLLSRDSNVLVTTLRSEMAIFQQRSDQYVEHFHAHISTLKNPRQSYATMLEVMPPGDQMLQHVSTSHSSACFSSPLDENLMPNTIDNDKVDRVFSIN